MILAIRRWWFQLWHPEYCPDCGGRRMYHGGRRTYGETLAHGAVTWTCPPCEHGEEIERMRRTEARLRELFGGRK